MSLSTIPILKLGDYLILSIQIDMSDTVALQLQENLAQRVADTGAKGVLIDISSLDIVDSFIGRTLATMAEVCRCMGATTVVVGMQPAVAMTLVELGVSWAGIPTALNVDRGVEILDAALSDSLRPCT